MAAGSKAGLYQNFQSASYFPLTLFLLTLFERLKTTSSSAILSSIFCFSHSETFYKNILEYTQIARNGTESKNPSIESHSINHV